MNLKSRRKENSSEILSHGIYQSVSLFLQPIKLLETCLYEIRKIAVCFLWLSLPGDCRVTDVALLAETT